MKKIDRKIHQLDATGQPLGRLATEIAIILQGKNRADFSSHLDTGDSVEVTNCKRIKFSGKKLEQKEYIWHTNYPGGLKRKKVGEIFAANPGEVLKRAVLGMLPKNRLRDSMIKRLIIK